MQLTSVQLKQLDGVVRQTRITRGENAGKRKDSLITVEHFDMRSFNKLLTKKLVAPSEYDFERYYATELGYRVWLVHKGD